MRLFATAQAMNVSDPSGVPIGFIPLPVTYQGRFTTPSWNWQAWLTRDRRDEMSQLLSELRADRDRIADELKSKESELEAVEAQLGKAADDLEQLRADADRTRTLAREIVDIDKLPGEQAGTE